jgi:hypothetical protein
MLPAAHHQYLNIDPHNHDGHQHHALDEHEAPFDEDVQHVLHGERKFLQCSWIERCGRQRDTEGGGEGHGVGHRVRRSHRWGQRWARGAMVGRGRRELVERGWHCARGEEPQQMGARAGRCVEV